jgi:hypothetical protein
VNNPNDKDLTGRAAFEKWEALGEQGEAPWNLAQSAALLVALAQECQGNDWGPNSPQEHHAAQLLLQAIGRAGKCIIDHCKTCQRVKGVFLGTLTIGPDATGETEGETAGESAQQDSEITPEQSQKIARRATELIDEEYGLLKRSDALRQAAEEMGIELEPPSPPANDSPPDRIE